jgi:HSP20 family protein
MSLSRWFSNYDPFEEIRDIQKRFNHLFGEINNGLGKNGKEERSFWRPRVDVRETEIEFLIHADLPGLDKEQVNIELDNGTLTITGERNFEKKEENEQYHRIERGYGRFMRTFSVPENLDPATISAKFEKGVLEVSVPKPAEKKNPVTKIPIN